jgi:hypothetical protein
MVKQSYQENNNCVSIELISGHFDRLGNVTYPNLDYLVMKH